MKEFLAMGGYGFYVWSCYGIATLMFVSHLFFTRKQHKKMLQNIQHWQQRNYHDESS